MKTRWFKALMLGGAGLLLSNSGQALALPNITLSGQQSQYDPQSWIFTVSMDNPRQIYLSCHQDGDLFERHLIRGSKVSQQTLTVRGLKADTEYTCVARRNKLFTPPSNPVHFKTAPLPEDLLQPRVKIPSRDPSTTGYTLYNVGNMYYSGDLKDPFDPEKITTANNYLVILDPDGNIRWYLPGPGAGDLEARYLGNGRILYGGQGVPQAYPPTIVNLDKKTLITGNQNRTLPYEFGDSTGLYYNHEANLAPDGRSVFTLIHTISPKDMITVGFIVKQLSLDDPDGNGVMDNVEWYWDSFTEARNGQIDHTNEHYENDPLHANTVWTENGDDGRLYVYVSMRNASRIMKIDYATKQVLWELGADSDDFMLLNENGLPAADRDWFFNQHDVQFHDGLVTMHDNGADRYMKGGLPHTRTMAIELDEKNMIARIVNEYTEPGWLEPFWGGYDILPSGHQLLAKGHCGFCSIPFQDNTSFIELDANNNVLWRAEYGPEGSDLMLYRAQHIDSCDIFDNRQYCTRLENILTEQEQ